jgi:cupin 2 domain-containing protein
MKKKIIENIFSGLSCGLDVEAFDEIVRSNAVRIERILSKGHTSPETGWYDQEENEWVIVLQGSARLLFADGYEAVLNPGDHITIAAHEKHKVNWTNPDEITVWLAVFYKQEACCPSCPGHMPPV